MERGQIENRERYLQAKAIDFSGMVFGNITPTDIDGSLDFGGETFFFIELKYGDSQLKIGQRLHLQYLAKAIEAGRKTAFVIIGSHYTPIGEDIKVHEATVTEYWMDGKWYSPYINESITIKEAIEKLKTGKDRGFL